MGITLDQQVGSRKFAEHGKSRQQGQRGNLLSQDRLRALVLLIALIVSARETAYRAWQVASRGRPRFPAWRHRHALASLPLA